MDAIYEQNFEIKTYDLDMKKQLKISSLFNYFQEAATNHAYQLEANYKEIKERDVFWVLSRIKVIIDRLPKWHEKITIRTWAKSTDKLFFVRDFQVLDASQKEMIRATSYWVLLKTKKHQLIPAKKAPFQIPCYKQHALKEELVRFQMPKEMEKVREVPICYTDIDINQHMNNAKYIDLLMNTLDEKSLLTKEIKALQMNYIAESKLGDKMETRRLIKEDMAFVEGIQMTSGQISFHASIQFAPLKS